MDRIGRAIPGDDWVVGHRVGLRIKQGEYDEALSVARECRASAWWCAELAGSVLQILGEVEAADSAFAAALERRPPEERCGSGDLSQLLDRRRASEYRAMDCEEREAFERRFWWLADPLYIRAPNDRRTEHRKRLVAQHLHEEMLEVAGGRCLAHLPRSLRIGWPEEVWWTNRGEMFMASSRPGDAFLPRQATLTAPLEVVPGEWAVEPGEYTDRYTPPYGPVYSIEQQVAFFRRGDSAVVVAATELSGHPLALRGPRTAGLVHARSELDEPVVDTTHGPELRPLFMAEVPAERHVVSVEVLGERGGAGRARFAAGLPPVGSGGLGLSDLLLFEWDEDLDSTLEAVMPRMLGTTSLEADSGVGVYWESYGAKPDESATVSLRVIEEEGGFLRRVGRFLRLVGPRESARYAWEEGLREGRSLRLDVSNLDPGRYVLEVRVEAASGEVQVRRNFEVVEVGGVRPR